MAGLGLGGLRATALAAGAAVCLTSGCSTIGYYAQSAAGHLDLVQAARPVAAVAGRPGDAAPR